LTDEDKRVYEAYGMLTRTDSDQRTQKRGIVLLDADRVVRYRWIADDNWDPWEMEPLHEAYEIGKELVAPDE
jgi:peroxiredoxin